MTWMVVITDPEGSIEYVNQKFIDLTGYSFEEASRAMSDFPALVSHELRIPLNSIFRFSQILNMQTSGALTKELETDIYGLSIK